MSDDDCRPEVIFIYETVAQAMARDASVFVTIIALWSIGHWAGSAALEWVGVIIALLVVMARAVRFMERKTKGKMTPREARRWLDEHFPEGSK